jgi:hypothetical protein
MAGRAHQEPGTIVRSAHPGDLPKDGEGLAKCLGV